jgi:uncharacterized protein DUF6519
MKGDFTRRTFRRADRYRGVLMQQGRVQLDADWNEQYEIQRYHDETTARDAIGAHGAPVGAAGFAVTDPDGYEPRACRFDELTISRGRYYVDGILCENDAAVRLVGQPDLAGVAEPGEDGRYVAYLDVWFEHVTAVEDPRLLEVALGGADTATRARTVWQLKIQRLAAHDAVAADVAPPWTPAEIQHPRELRARAVPVPGATAGPIPPSAGYRGLRNQLYRVEVRADGTDPTAEPTFVWSRDNGSVTAPVAELASVPGTDERNVRLAGPPRDAVSGFPPGCWVEIVDPARARRGEPGFLGRVSRTSSEVDLTVGEWDGAVPTAADLTRPVTLRRWDSPGPVPVGTGWLPLEDGVEVQFSAEGVPRCGDHWLIPARTAAVGGAGSGGEVQWPGTGGDPEFAPPDGVTHHCAAVALLDLRDGVWTRVADCRATFAPLAVARADPAAYAAPGLHVEEVSLVASGGTLHNDLGVLAAELYGGLAVHVDGTPTVLGATSRPVVTVTLDLPQFDGQTTRLLGTRPITLAATVATVGDTLVWTPTADVVTWLGITVADLSGKGVDRLLCTLRIDGRSVVDGVHRHRMLNGLAITRARSDGTVELLLPTVDDVRGADFSTWFWLDAKPKGGLFDSARFDTNTFNP